MTDPLELLVRLIETPSVNPSYDLDSPGEDAVGHLIADHASALGLDVTRDEVLPGRHNVLATLRTRQRRLTLMIEGHLDTVGLPLGDSRPAPRVEGTIVHGRGACDVKGALTATLLALEELAADPPQHVEVALLGAIDEEYRFRGISAYLAAHPAPDVAVVLEPTGLEVVGSHNGVLRLEVLIRGEAGHTSRPAQGRNAIADAATVIESLHAWAEPEVVTVTTIRGGQAINIVPDECVLGVDVRVAPQDDPEVLLAQVRARLAALDGVRAEVSEVLLADGGMHTPADSPFALAALAAAGRTELAAVPYGTDGSKLARAGVPTVVFGPGSIADAHGDHEWVDLRDVEAAARTLVTLVRSLDQSLRVEPVETSLEVT